MSGEYPEDAAGRTYTFTSRSVRFVCDYLNGSTTNASDHWVEIEAWGYATTAYFGNYFEWTGNTNTMAKYYYDGSQRVAIRRGSTLQYLLSDHLGSTSISADAVSGSRMNELRYKPWGENRYSSYSETATPTDRRFTGQLLLQALGIYH